MAFANTFVISLFANFEFLTCIIQTYLISIVFFKCVIQFRLCVIVCNLEKTVIWLELNVILIIWNVMYFTRNYFYISTLISKSTHNKLVWTHHCPHVFRRKQITLYIKTAHNSTASFNKDSQGHQWLLFRAAMHSLVARFMGPTWGPSGDPCWPHEPRYLGWIRGGEAYESLIVELHIQSL